MPKTKDLPLVTTATGAETALVVLEDGSTARMESSTLLEGATGQQTSLQDEIDAIKARLLALEGASGPSAPSISTAVTISDTTPNVGDTLTASGGTPAGGSGTYTTFWQWYTVRVAEGKREIPGATTSSLDVLASMTGAQIIVDKWVVDSNGLPSVPRPSALTTAVGGTQSQAIILSGLPDPTTTSTSASISWTLTPAGGTVFCRRDSFAPAAAPNPFVLGSGTPLSVGAHRVDFYLSLTGDGTDIDPAVPMVSYSWTILAAATVTLSGLPANGTTSTTAAIDWTLSPSNAGFVIYKLDGAFQKLATHPINLTGLGVGSHTIDFYVTTSLAWDDVAFTLPAVTTSYTWSVAASGVVPLPQLGHPVNINVTGASGTYDGVNAISVSSVVRLGPVVDASGITVDRYRIVQNGTTEQRAEKLYGDTPYAVPLVCQREYWLAVVVERVAGELQTSSALDTECVVLQSHWSGYGATQPEWALFDNAQGDQMRWRASGSSTTPGNYADHGGSGTFNWHDTSEPGYVNPWVTAAETRPAAGVKWRYIIRWKPGWTDAHDKILQIWRGKPGEAMVNITTGGVYTGVNAYNDNNNGLSIASYPREGLYKYSGVNWSNSTVGYLISRWCMAENTTGDTVANMLARATASVAWAA